MGRFDKFKINPADMPEEKPRGSKIYERKEGEKAWTMKVGLHDNCLISSVEDIGVSDKDPTFFKLCVTIQEFKAEIRTWLMVPTVGLLFGPNKQDFAIRNLMAFTKALGIELTRDNANIVIPALFSDPNRLKGLRIGVVVGHKSHYVTKDNGEWIIRDKSDKPLLSADNVNPEVFSDITAAKMFAESKALGLSAFPEIKYFREPKVANDPKILGALLEASPVEAKKESKCPF